VRGEIELDNGAVMKLRESGVSILPVGVVSSRGHFSKGEAVLCVDSLGNPIAKGLIDYPSNDVQKLLGVSSEDILHHLGYRGSDELMHRDNLVLL
jgi:glutamate 5-kinase